MGEEWKVVPGSDGKLLASNLGRVKSLMRDGRILRAQRNKKGYLVIRSTINREKKTFRVHRIVATLFVPNPDNLPQVNHIDGDKTNNCATNLEWITNYDNAHHAIANGLWGNVFAASAATAERTRQPIYSVDAETGERRDFESISAAERFFNTRHICDVLSRKRNKAAGQYFYRR